MPLKSFQSWILTLESFSSVLTPWDILTFNTKPWAQKMSTMNHGGRPISVLGHCFPLFTHFNLKGSPNRYQYHIADKEQQSRLLIISIWKNSFTWIDQKIIGRRTTKTNCGWKGCSIPMFSLIYSRKFVFKELFDKLSGTMFYEFIDAHTKSSLDSSTSGISEHDVQHIKAD